MRITGGLALRNVNNDNSNGSFDTAQYLSHPTGRIVVEGLVGGVAVDAGDGDDDEPQGDLGDVYAIPLMAGQTIRVDGEVFYEYYDGYEETYPFIDVGVVALLYDPDFYWVDSLGYETVEDVGRFTEFNETQKPLIFTAPTAGVYYLAVFGPPVEYRFTIENGPAAALRASCPLRASPHRGPAAKGVTLHSSPHAADQRRASRVNSSRTIGISGSALRNCRP